MRRLLRAALAGPDEPPLPAALPRRAAVTDRRRPLAARLRLRRRTACRPRRSRPLPPLRRAGRLVGVLGMLVPVPAWPLLLPLLPARRAGAACAAGPGLRARPRRTAGGPRAGCPAGGRCWSPTTSPGWTSLAVLAVAPARLLAKREVRGWPLVGPLAAAAGTIFVDRARPRDAAGHGRPGRGRAARRRAVSRSSRRARPGAATRRTAGRAVPAGDVPGGHRRRAPGGAAADRYRCAAPAPDDGAAFLGDETLCASVRRVPGRAGAPWSIGDRPRRALHPGADRRLLARAAESVGYLVPRRPAVGAGRAGPGLTGA